MTQQEWEIRANLIKELAAGNAVVLNVEMVGGELHAEKQEHALVSGNRFVDTSQFTRKWMHIITPQG